MEFSDISKWDFSVVLTVVADQKNLHLVQIQSPNPFQGISVSFLLARHDDNAVCMVCLGIFVH